MYVLISSRRTGDNCKNNIFISCNKQKIIEQILSCHPEHDFMKCDIVFHSELDNDGATSFIECCTNQCTFEKKNGDKYERNWCNECFKSMYYCGNCMYSKVPIYDRLCDQMSYKFKRIYCCDCLMECTCKTCGYNFYDIIQYLNMNKKNAYLNNDDDDIKCKYKTKYTNGNNVDYYISLENIEVTRLKEFTHSTEWNH